MKIKEIYNENKKKFSDYILIIKVGIFYETYNNDAFIINNLFGYKVKEIGDFDRAGFPVNSFDKVIKKLERCEINYVIIDGGIVSKKFKNNNYSKYLKCDYSSRIEMVVNKLNSLKGTKKLESILVKVENIL